MIKRVRIMRILLLLAAMAVGALAWLKASSWYDRFMQERARDEIALSPPQMEAGAVFYLALDRPTGQDGALPAFGLWHLPTSEDMASSVEDAIMDADVQMETENVVEAEETSYVLFVPGAARRTGLRVQFEGELSLDGQPLVSGQRLELAEGEHLLETLDGIWPFSVMYGSDLPCMFIEMSSGSLDAVHAEKGAMDLASVALIQTDGLVEYTGSIWMRGRGNAGWYADKKSYQITTEERTGLLGMSAARHWLLLANVYDGSLLRDQAVFTVAQEVRMPYTPNSQQIELYVQGEYRGCYLLCEKIEVDSARIDIPDMDEMNQAAVRGIGAGWNESPDLCCTDWDELTAPGSQRYYELAAEVPPESGGYLFELDKAVRYINSDNPGFITREGYGVTIKSPAFATKRQVEYLAVLFQQLEDINYPLDDSMLPETLGQLIDLHSFAQKYLIEEITQNYDASMTSQFFYKLPDSISTKLYAGPVWDYDFAFSNSDKMFWSFAGIEDFWANQKDSDYFFWAGLYSYPDFRQEVYRCFWQEYVPVIDRMLDEDWFWQQAQDLSASACMDMYRWQGESAPEAYCQAVAEVENFLDIRMAFLKNEWQRDPSEWGS